MKHADTWGQCIKSGWPKVKISFLWQSSTLSLVNYFVFLWLCASTSMTQDESKPWLMGLEPAQSAGGARSAASDIRLGTVRAFSSHATGVFFCWRETRLLVWGSGSITRRDATSFAPSSVCDEQWHETKRPLLLPPAQEASKNPAYCCNRFRLWQHVRHAERSHVIGVSDIGVKSGCPHIRVRSDTFNTRPVIQI